MKRYKSKFEENYDDPYRVRDDLKQRIIMIAQKLDNLYISDRYYPEDVDYDKSLFNNVNKVLKNVEKVVSTLEKLSI